ncbi:amino acid ABC transporter permease [Iamia sp. SCSIO 61187]|uniref:amino acid ABC transporter permease n=1 Tax=Iamia sp. SCSIO 61187 TaxID=2722752 RepID=UPI001C634AEC|nr:amino acid ABC transporter permease [Iamia sp. SCSIO 61187]QYG91619.1 amino acid ABC transporter permease [Iamia sp. SCSIO 61187]
MDHVWENRDLILDGFRTTVWLTVSSGVLSLLFGTVLAIMRVGPIPPLRWLGTTYVTLVRNTPLTLVFIFSTFGLPRMEVRLSFVAFAIVALTIYTTAFVCEAVRSGINAVDAGEIEAARAIGLPFRQVLTLVVLPQAYRAVIPPLTGVLNALLKNTSVAVAFNVAEANQVLRRLQNADASATFPLLFTTGLGYIILASVLFLGSWALERAVDPDRARRRRSGGGVPAMAREAT